MRWTRRGRRPPGDNGIVKTMTTDWRSDWQCGPTARTIAEMIYDHTPAAGEEISMVYEWLDEHGRLDEAHKLARNASAAWRRGHPWTATRVVDGVADPEQVVGWSNADEAARSGVAAEAFLALVGDVRAAVSATADGGALRPASTEVRDAVNPQE